MSGDRWPPEPADDEQEAEAAAAAPPLVAGQPHPVEWVRDIPRACTCIWAWNPKIRAYELESERYGCPWHGHDLEGA